MGDDERRVKRSRFDQTEPEPRKPSRFDRRSRSPSRHIDLGRSRSPLGRDPRSPASADKRSASLDPAAAAGDYIPLIVLIGANSFKSRRRSKDQCRAPSQKGRSACRCASHSICEASSSSRNSPSDHAVQTASPLPKSSSPSAGQSTSNLNGDIYIADGDYIKDIEVNDLRNRYTLTKGSTQKTVNIFVIISTDLFRPQTASLFLFSVHLCAGH